jgi:hypothetical protein
MESYRANRKIALIFLAILNVVIIIAMQKVAVALLPGGIIPFEFAWSLEKAQLMVNHWQRNGVMPQLLFLLGVDYAFMLTYSSFLHLACRSVSERIAHPKVSVAFLFIAWLQPVAGLLDAVENYSLYQVATGTQLELWPRVALLCAVPKFTIVLIGLLAILLSLLFRKNKSAQ